MIRYEEDPAVLAAEQLAGGFFAGWPEAPSPDLHLAHLLGSEVAICAIDDETGQVVGFVSAIGDGVLTAFIPLLEVLPAYRGCGIATALVERVLARLSGRYAVDLTCDPELIPFYERLGGRAWHAVVWRAPSALLDDGQQRAVNAGP